jgi:putative oxidoreductase
MKLFMSHIPRIFSLDKFNLRCASNNPEMKQITFITARVLYAVPLGVFGIRHLTHIKTMAPYVPLPWGEFWIVATGIALIAAAVAILTGILARLASYLLALMITIFILSIHLPHMFNPATIQSALPNLLKDFSIVGGALAFAVLFSIFPGKK